MKKIRHIISSKPASSSFVKTCVFFVNLCGIACVFRAVPPRFKKETQSFTKEGRVNRVLILFFLFVNLSLFAQPRYTLKLHPLDQSENFIKNKIKISPSFSDSLSVQNELANILLQLHGQAYLEASIDSVFLFENIFNAWVFVGKKYEWATLENGNVAPAFLEQVGFRQRLYQGKDFYYREVLKLQEALLTYAENNGYPFAQVGLRNIKVQDGKIAAQLFMKKNKLITISKIKIKGDAKISARYLENYLGIKKGSLYDKSKVVKIRQRIRELPFVKKAKNLTITFNGNKATVNLFLQKKKASRFDFLVGVLPRKNPAPGKRNFLVTGTFNMDMHNQFGIGERIFAEFEQLSPGTQKLDLQFTYPYILNFPFGIDFDFELYKRDSSYLQVESDFGIQYLLEGGNYFKVFWNNQTTNLLTVNESQIIASKKLPAELDIANSTFGVEYNLQKLDYRFNPRKGWGTILRAGAGFKHIKENNSILGLMTSDPSFTFQSLYDSLTLRTFQYQLEGQVEKYFPVFKRSTFKTSLRSGWVIAQAPILKNEQFRIGGNKLLRGFDEESVFATNYVIATAEYRLLIGQNSFFFVFADYGYVENVTKDIRTFDTPLGLGGGMTFETKVGIFGISLAVGKQQGNPFDFRNVKTHFGYVSYF